MTSSTFRIGGELVVRRLGFGAMKLPTSPGQAREASMGGVPTRLEENTAASNLRLSEDQWRRLDRLQPGRPG